MKPQQITLHQVHPTNYQFIWLLLCFSSELPFAKSSGQLTRGNTPQAGSFLIFFFTWLLFVNEVRAFIPDQNDALIPGSHNNLPEKLLLPFPLRSPPTNYSKNVRLINRSNDHKLVTKPADVIISLTLTRRPNSRVSNRLSVQHNEYHHKPHSKSPDQIWYSINLLSSIYCFSLRFHFIRFTY